MTKAELVSHIAAETSTTTAPADRMVIDVFFAIADALARDESVAIAGFGKFAVRDRTARLGRAVPEAGAGRNPVVEDSVVQAGESPSRRPQPIA